MTVSKLNVRLLAAAGFALLAGAAATPASAGALADACVASGGGAVDAKTCACIETKSAASPADQKVLLSSFELSVKLLKGQSIPTDAATSEAMSKGAEAQGKYLQQCM